MHRMGISVCPLLFAVLLLPAGGAAQTATNAPGPVQALILAGSTTISPLVTDIARRFERLNPGVRIEIRPGSSGKGLADLRAKAADIAMVARPLTARERDLFEFPLCRDGAAIIVHRSNPLRGMNRRQLTEVLTGQVVDWKQLAAHSGEIKLAWRAGGGAISDLLLDHLKLKPEQVRVYSTVRENTDAIEFASSDRNAITLSALAAAERSVKAGAPIKLLAFEGVAASPRAVRDRTYPLSRPLSLVTSGVPAGLQKRFVDYAVSDAVTDLHEKHGFVPYQE